MRRANRISIGLLLSAVLVAVQVRVTAAQGAGGHEVATVAAVVGGAELQRAGAGDWQLMVVGSSLFTGDHVRTRATSRVKLVFQDDSVVDVGPATEMVIDKEDFNQSTRHYRSALKLVTGKIRALVSEYYGAPNSRYEVETPTAVAGVRGTEFIVMYDPKADYTDVVVLENEVVVEGTLGVVGGTVRVGPQMASRVQKGRFPSAPRKIDAALLQQYLEGLDIVGTGGHDSLGSAHAAVKGQLLSPTDSASQVGKVARTARTAGLVVGAPDQPPGASYSKDIGTNTQPLNAFQVTPPGSVPKGGVHVGF
jgi:hypothetical protein